MASEKSSGKGLGKGLGALLGDAALQTQSQGSLSLPISQVEPGLKQPRKRFDQESLSDLADSIRVHGILQPITVRRLSSGYYQIIAGERRWRAAKEAGLREVPAVIVEADDRKVMELALIENLQREDLNPMEEATGYRTLMEEYSLTQEETAKRVGKSRPVVANAMRLLTLPQEIGSLVEEGTLTTGHARALLALPSAKTQIRAAKQVIEQKLSVRQTEELVKKIRKPSPEKSAKVQPQQKQLEIYLKEAEKNLSTRYSRRVKIVQGKRKGKIELEYYDQNDLQALLDALTPMGGGGEAAR
ncbi:Stage 0 sporulation protein J [bioreactor metagenome]|uniref:Stage 0 sporulation protein J n=1 Tax=bioreactor metagenome TaxID=1076179 RepID=A0A644WYU6_9ZZZZ